MLLRQVGLNSVSDKNLPVKRGGFSLIRAHDLSDNKCSENRMSSEYCH